MGRIMDEMDLEGLVVFGSREGAFPARSRWTISSPTTAPALSMFPRGGEPRVLAFALAVGRGRRGDVRGGAGQDEAGCH